MTHTQDGGSSGSADRERSQFNCVHHGTKWKYEEGAEEDDI